MPTKHQSFIPMTPDDLPQQHMREVVTVPDKPKELEISYAPCLAELNGKTLGTPRNLEFLCSVEWAWSPVHGRIDNYYLNRKRKHWVLWNNWMDDNDASWSWHWTVIAYAPRIKANELAVASHLLFKAWESQKEQDDLDQYHWINNNEYLETSEIEAVARHVWGDN